MNNSPASGKQPPARNGWRFWSCSARGRARLKALLKRVRKGLATVLDVRPPTEYRFGHIAGAISIPFEELKNRLAELPRDQDIVAYCRGPYCVLAAQAVELLREHGFQALRLEDGVADWRAHGLPILAGDRTS